MQNNLSWIQLLQSWINRKANLIAIGFILLFLVTGVLTLPYYGLTWDEGLGNLFFGERYLHYFTSFDPIHLNFQIELSYNKNNILNLFHSPFHEIPWEFPPVADTLSAATMILFSYILGWMNPVDGFHLFTVILSAGFLWVLYHFAAAHIGRFEAILTIVFLSLFPRFWGDMHFNVKDVPEAVFFGLTIISYISWLEKHHCWKAILTGALGGLALGIKANALFIPIILCVSLMPWNLDLQSWKYFLNHLRRKAGDYAIMLLTAGLIYIISWPYLYANPFRNLVDYWSYIFSQGGRVGDFNFQIDPIRQVIFSMPEIMLIALLLGIIFAFTNIEMPFWRILISWLAFPILRSSLPGVVNFDGIRHFLEFVPAAALIAAYGVGRISTWLSTHNVSLIVSRSIFIILVILNLSAIYLNYFPYLHIYYNELTNGLAGARNGWLGHEAGDYWASSYRQGMIWLSQNAPQGSSVRGMTAEWIVDLTGPLFLRPDIQIMSNKYLPDFDTLKESNNSIYLMFVIRDWSHMDALAYCQKHQEPVYEIKVDGVPIMQIFRFGRDVP